VKNYELIEHTADIGIRVKGKELKDLFRNAALAMFDIIAEKDKTAPAGQKRIKIEQSADDPEELFINWLNELLSLSATKELIFSDFRIDKFDGKHLQATACGCDVGNFKVNAEIKAATYHGLEIKKNNSGWQASVIFDV
jgi:SHS2 domain-containing protein